MINRQILEEVGLTEYESKIYLSLLANGQISAYSLAEKSGLYRQVVYDSLKRLEEKGFVNSTQEGKTKLFKATNPNIILELLKAKTQNFQEQLPELLALDKSSQKPLSVETYKGENILRIALRDIINTLKESDNKLLLCTAVDEYFLLDKYKLICEQYERDLIHYNIKEKIIIKEGIKGLLTKGTSKYKRIPKKFFNENPMQIYGDNVQMIVLGNPDYLIIIRSKNVADAYRKQFELMWQTAK